MFIKVLGSVLLVSGLMLGQQSDKEAAKNSLRKMAPAATERSQNEDQSVGMYRIVQRFRLGGKGDIWDYLAADHSRIFLARGTRVMVIDADTGKVIGKLPGSRKVHAVVIAKELNRILVSNGATNEVRVFDLKTLRQVGSVPVGENPDAMTYETSTQRLFVSNGDSKDVTVVDVKALKAIGTIPMDGNPEFSVQDAGMVYVNIEDKNQIAVIDSKSLAVVDRWGLGQCAEPTGLAIDRYQKRLFSACGNKLLTIVDVPTKSVVGYAPIGEACDGVAFDINSRRVLTSNADGTLTVVGEVSPRKYEVLQTLRTRPGARTITYDEDRQRVLIPAASYAQVNRQSTPAYDAPILPGSFEILLIAVRARRQLGSDTFGNVSPNLRWTPMNDPAKAFPVNSTASSIGGTAVWSSVGINEPVESCIAGVNWYLPDTHFRVQANYAKKTFHGDVVPTRDMLFLNFQTSLVATRTRVPLAKRVEEGQVADKIWRPLLLPVGTNYYVR